MSIPHSPTSARLLSSAMNAFSTPDLPRPIVPAVRTCSTSRMPTASPSSKRPRTIGSLMLVALVPGQWMGVASGSLCTIRSTTRFALLGTEIRRAAPRSHDTTPIRTHHRIQARTRHRRRPDTEHGRSVGAAVTLRAPNSGT